jgi:DNA topoisomerase-1
MKTKPHIGAAAVAADPVTAAAEAGLRYSQDSRDGIRRVRSGKGFRYLSPKGRIIRDRATLARIKALAIPPAWTDVWICPDERGHLQATGRDDRGRKQYRYHPRWREVRDESKFGRLAAFGKALPRMRSRIRRDLKLPGLPREKVLATVVRLLETTLIRVGNEEYARHNGSYGLTTMRNRHARVRKDEIHFEFRGKSGVPHRITIRNPRLARIVNRCRDIPGQELFQYLDDSDERHPIESADVNDYLRAISGADYTAKDFRTWAGTVQAVEFLQEAGPAKSPTAAKRTIARAVKAVAQRLGNTAAVCRKCYIHPGVLDAYLDGSLAKSRAAPTQRQEERGLLKLLRKCTRGDSRKK